jgi:hypothetical protein
MPDLYRFVPRAAAASFSALSAFLLLGLAPVPAVAAPDLVVRQVDISGLVYACATNVAAGTVRATVENAGDTSTGSGFRVRFFEDRNGNGTYDGADLAFGEAILPPLAAGGQVVASLVASAAVTFSGDLVHAFADSRNTIAESNETNNLANSGGGCGFAPGAGSFNPVVEWVWNASAIQSDALNVFMTPAVIDLNGDAVPDIVFGSTASTSGGYVEAGLLRALNGSNGAELFSVTDPALALNVAASIAVGDIDNDGLPEILAVDASAEHLLCFENDGTYKWTSDLLELTYWGAPAIADLDQDGTPEIILGRQALNNDGTIRWTGTGGRGTTLDDSPLALVSDVDADGTPNVVAGNTVYGPNGAILYQNLALPDGLNAVANFDLDPAAEIVLVGGGSLWLLEHDCSVIWGPIEIPGGGGGPPTVADYDGDGLPEIGVASLNAYTVFEGDGTIKWTSPTQDNSYVTGSSVFDFEGDGSAEVVYRDELFLRVYRGGDGTVLYQVPMSSCTWHEYPVVADVDADGNAEIVVVANNNCGLGAERGIYVIGDAGDSWVSTRRIWNEHTYHITNVNDDGTIPQFEQGNWLSPPGQPYNNFRQNVLPGVEPLAAPNLTASGIQVDLTHCPGYLGLVARVGNGGSNVAAAPVSVAFYDGDPSGGGALLGVASTSVNLFPGHYEDVTFLAPPSLTGAHTICVAADDNGAGAGSVNECLETDNLCCRSMVIVPCDAAGVGNGPGSLADKGGALVTPNPARTAVAIGFELTSPGDVAVSIFDAAGRLVRKLETRAAGSGRQVLNWDLEDSNGGRVGAGIYAYRIEAGRSRLSGTMIVVP